MNIDETLKDIVKRELEINKKIPFDDIIKKLIQNGYGKQEAEAAAMRYYKEVTQYRGHY